MLYSIKNSEDLEILNKLVSLKSQVKAVRLQDKPSKQNFHENMKKFFDPVSKSLENTSQDKTKTMLEISYNNNKALENINNKLLEIMNNTGILPTYLMPPLSKITDPDKISQFKLVQDHCLNRVNDLLIKVQYQLLYIAIC